MLWKPGRIRATSTDQLFARLREDIVNGVRPPGSPLSVGAVAKEYDVSRTAARDALQRLGVSGLLRAVNGETTVVAEADLDAARDAQLVVAEMHRLALLLAVPRLTRGDIAAMRAANDRFVESMRRGDVDDALAADIELHDVPVQVCGNDTVRAVLDQYQPMIMWLERMRYETWDVDDAWHQHDRLANLCEEGRTEEAADYAEELWHLLDDAVPSQFQRRIPNPVRPGQRASSKANAARVP